MKAVNYNQSLRGRIIDLEEYVRILNERLEKLEKMFGPWIKELEEKK